MKTLSRFIKIFNSFKERKTKTVIAVCVCGTGGHVMPGLATAIYFKEQEYNVIILTDKRGYTFIEKNNHNFNRSDIFIINDISYTRNIKNFKNIIFTIFTIWKILRKRKVSLLISFGSYLGLVSVLSAFLRRTKIAIHQSDIIFGLANKISSFFSNFIFLGFKKIQTTKFFNFFNKKKLVYTGIPIRDEILAYSFKKSYNINYDIIYQIGDFDNINILILGGSQGCDIITRSVSLAINSLSTFLKSRLTIFHQVKQEQVESVKNFYNSININAEVFSFTKDIGHFMSQAHLCITRSGASTLAELACIGVPSILIPMKKSANNHQFYNAEYFVKNDMAIMLEEDNLNPENFSIFLTQLLKNKELVLLLSKNVKEYSNPNGKKNIFNFVNNIFNSNHKDIKTIKNSSYKVDKGFVVK